MMKIDLLDWIIEKLKLSDEEEENIAVQEVSAIHKKKPKQDRLFLKYVQDCKDCMEVVDELKMGAVCIIFISETEKTQSQFLIHYLSGAAYSLEINILNVGKKVYLLA